MNNLIFLCKRNFAKILIFMSFLLSPYIILLYQNEIQFFDINILVKEIDTAKYCKEGHFSFSKAERSEIPKNSFSNYCGLIFTDFGSFEVLPTNYLWPNVQTRNFILDNVEVNCRYNVKIVGTGTIPRLGDLPRAPTTQMITRINKALGCT